MSEPRQPAPRRYHPFLHLTLARLREFLREPEAVFWVYVFPLFLVVALGVAFRNRPVEAFRVAVCQAEQAASVCSVLAGDPRFQSTICLPNECRRLLRTGRADLMIAFSHDSSVRYEYYYDPARAESVLARSSADALLQRASGRRDVVEVRDHPVDEPGGRYIDFLVPGLLGMGLMGGGLWGVGFAVVDMRIRKLLKRYVATPMKRSHFMGAILVSRLLFTVSEALVLLVFARVFFGVANQGSYLAISVLVLLGSLAFSGIGLLVATRAQTIETVSGLMNAVMLPMWIGSGIFFSTARFPEAVQPALFALPLTPLIHAMRSIMLEGTSIWSLGVDVSLVAGWGVASFSLALRWFRWK